MVVVCVRCAAGLDWGWKGYRVGGRRVGIGKVSAGYPEQSTVLLYCRNRQTSLAVMSRRTRAYLYCAS